MIRPAVFALAITALLTPRASGAQVVSMSFSEMVAAADVIVRAEVVTRHSEWTTTRDGPVIVTQVTFRVEDTLKGDARLQLVLEFLGGTVGDETMRFSEVPTFEVGERAVLFAHTRELMVSPVVGVMQGRFPIRSSPDGTREFVTLFDGKAFTAVDQVTEPVLVSPTPMPTMSLEVFETEIARLVGAPG